MARIVQKYGGTSVADIDCIRNVARRVQKEVEDGNQIAVVVSAMAGVTNQLSNWCRELNGQNHSSEIDVILATGEQATSGLLALALMDLGVEARSWLGWQIPIYTDTTYTKARIDNINCSKLMHAMEKGQVAVVSGFQGLSTTNRITTLGRGGSDTSAVALAAAVNAQRCDIYTDVEGVYTTDPRIVPRAQKIDLITYEEMLEMASQGAKILQTRAVALAMRYKVNLQVLSSFSDTPGTLVIGEDQILEQQTISGIAYSPDEAKITLRGVKDRPGVAASIFGSLADSAINVDMIVQNVSEDGETTDLTFTVDRGDLERATRVLENLKKEIHFSNISADASVAKISVVGVGMRSQPGVAKTMFQALAERGINIQVISTSEIKVSVLISAEYTELAIRALHTAYGLDSQHV